MDPIRLVRMVNKIGELDTIRAKNFLGRAFGVKAFSGLPRPKQIAVCIEFVEAI